jgi:hypothetical protein
MRYTDRRQDTPRVYKISDIRKAAEELFEEHVIRDLVHEWLKRLPEDRYERPPPKQARREWSSEDEDEDWQP